MIKQVGRSWAIAKSRTRVTEISSSSQYSKRHFVRRDLRDSDFARTKLNYRGRTRRRLCKILTFPLQHLLTHLQARAMRHVHLQPIDLSRTALSCLSSWTC